MGVRVLYLLWLVCLAVCTHSAFAADVGMGELDIEYRSINDVRAIAPNLYNFGMSNSADKFSYVCRIIGMLPAEKKLTISGCFVADMDLMMKMTDGRKGRSFAVAYATGGGTPKCHPTPSGGGMPLILTDVGGQPMMIFTWSLQDTTMCISGNGLKSFPSGDAWKSENRHCSGFTIYATKAYANNDEAQMRVVQNEINSCTARQVWNALRQAGNTPEGNKIAETATKIAKFIVGKVPTIGEYAGGLWDLAELIHGWTDKARQDSMREAEKRTQAAIANSYLVPNMLVLAFSEKNNQLGDASMAPSKQGAPESALQPNVIGGALTNALYAMASAAQTPVRAFFSNQQAFSNMASSLASAANAAVSDSTGTAPTRVAPAKPEEETDTAQGEAGDDEEERGILEKGRELAGRLTGYVKTIMAGIPPKGYAQGENPETVVGVRG